MLQKHWWMAAWHPGSPGPHICTLFSASHSELQGETKILKLKNLRPKDYANYSCIASVRNVCGIPDRRISFRLTNKTGHMHRNTSCHVKTDRKEVYMHVIVIKRCFEKFAFVPFLSRSISYWKKMLKWKHADQTASCGHNRFFNSWCFKFTYLTALNKFICFNWPVFVKTVVTFSFISHNEQVLWKHNLLQPYWDPTLHLKSTLKYNRQYMQALQLDYIVSLWRKKKILNEHGKCRDYALNPFTFKNRVGWTCEI